MQALLDFKFGWLNKERLLFVIGIVVLAFAAYSLAFAGSPGFTPVEKVTYKVNEEVMGPLPSFAEVSLAVKGNWRKDGAFFMLLDAPQLDLPAPEPPDFGLPLVLPPAYPQPSSSGNKNSAK